MDNHKEDGKKIRKQAARHYLITSIMWESQLARSCGAQASVDLHFTRLCLDASYLWWLESAGLRLPSYDLQGVVLRQDM